MSKHLNGNGQFAITTDLGNIQMFQINFNGNFVSIYGVNGAMVTVDHFGWDPKNGHSMEITIPTSELPDYNSSISFGYYQALPFLYDIVNLHPIHDAVRGRLSD